MVPVIERCLLLAGILRMEGVLTARHHEVENRPHGGEEPPDLESLRERANRAIASLNSFAGAHIAAGLSHSERVAALTRQNAELSAALEATRLDLETARSELQVAAQRQAGRSFGDVLERLDERFGVLADLGYFAWYTHCSAATPERPRANPADVELDELRRCLGAEGRQPNEWRLPDAVLPRLVDVDEVRLRLPLDLRADSADLETGSDVRLDNGGGDPSGLPGGFRDHHPPPVAALFVASRRFNLSDIDFYIDSAALYALATDLRSPQELFLQQWRGVVIIQAARSEPVDHFGAELARMLTGQPVNDSGAEGPGFQHLQVLRVSKYKVLVAGRICAVDEHRRPVECGRASSWPRVLLQMISSGSERLLDASFLNESGILLGLQELGLLQVSSGLNVALKLAGSRLTAYDDIVWNLEAHDEFFQSLGSGRTEVEGSPARVFGYGVAPDGLAPAFRFLAREEQGRRHLMPPADLVDELFSRG